VSSSARRLNSPNDVVVADAGGDLKALQELLGHQAESVAVVFVVLEPSGDQELARFRSKGSVVWATPNLGQVAVAAHGR
jgi:hypothetical protein